ncbi:MAG: glycosyltransferase family 4 protein [Deltaproteobacteria bacterium]|nr:glycosyltransferase family 4 protein [Deltaproteobacteria bacterium]
MRIGFLTTSFPRHEGDVAGSFVLGMARALCKRGHEVEVLAPEPSTGPGGTASRWAPGGAVDLRHVAYLRPRSLQRTFYGAGAPENLSADPLAWVGALPFGVALAASGLVRSRSWDAVVSHWLLPCGVVGALIRRGRPHLAVSHSADTHLLARLPPVAARRIASFLVRGSTAALFAAPDGRDRFTGLLDPADRGAFESRACVGPMGVDPPPPHGVALRARVRREQGLEGLVLLVMSRLVPVKGVRDLARALGREPGITVLVAGEGPERQAIEHAFAVHGARARMLGNVSGERKRDFLAAADALCLTSRVLPDGRTEGAPTAALEAMAAGLPVIATRVGGVASIVPDGAAGLLVAPGDDAALRAAVVALRDDPALRMALGRRARAHGRRYHWDSIAPRIEALLERRAPVAGGSEDGQGGLDAAMDAL